MHFTCSISLWCSLSGCDQTLHKSNISAHQHGRSREQDDLVCHSYSNIALALSWAPCNPLRYVHLFHNYNKLKKKKEELKLRKILHVADTKLSSRITMERTSQHDSSQTLPLFTRYKLVLYLFPSNYTHLILRNCSTAHWTHCYSVCCAALT